MRRIFILFSHENVFLLFIVYRMARVESGMVEYVLVVLLTHAAPLLTAFQPFLMTTK